MTRRLRALRWDLLRATQVARLGAGPLGWLRLMWAWVVLSMRRRPVRVRWRSGGTSFSALLSDVSQLWVLREVFFLEHYALPDEVQTEVIVDLGSNAGISVLYFAARFRTARIVAVEPDPDTWRLLQVNTAHLERVTPVHAAITDRDGEVPLFSGAESWESSVIPGPVHSTERWVPGMTLDTLAREHDLERIDLLKMDIEGSEVQVLRSAAALREAGTIIFEFHHEHSDEDLWPLVSRIPGVEHLRVVGDSDTHAMVTLTAGRKQQ